MSELWLHTYMYPEQPGSAPNGNPYDFIMQSGRKPQATGIGKVPGAGNPFIMKLAFLIGGAVVVMIAVVLGFNLVLGNKTNLNDIVLLAEQQQELIRISALSNQASDQAVLNAATNTQLTLITQQQQTLTFLAKHRRTVKPAELALKKNAKTDATLRTAQATSTFDTTFTNVVEQQLQDYAAALKSAYSKATSKSERTLLNNDYAQVALLLKQWPSQQASQNQP